MSNEKFSWVNTHKQIVEYLRTKKNSQKDLIELLKSVEITGFKDEEENGEKVELEELDPFTFFSYIYKYGSVRRLKILQGIAKKLNIKIPTDDFGIPSTNAQKVWLFPYKFNRNNNEISRLWSLFENTLTDTITDNQFNDALSIRNIGKTKLTESLFNVNPDKYFPINKPTKPYLKEKWGIDPNFNTYTEYLRILEQIKNKVNKPFYDLSYEAWEWNNTRKKTNYWVFQGNPKIYDVISALNDNALTTWAVKAHENKITVGDKIILWMTGNSQGCYALGEITSDVYEGNDAENERKYYIDSSKNKLSKRVKIIITHNLASNPITKEQINSTDNLKELNVGIQGTNFSATEDEYNTLLTLMKNSLNDFQSFIKKFDKNNLNVYFKTVKEIIDEFSLSKGDLRLVFSIRNAQLNFTVGQRYCVNLYASNPKGKYGVISQEKLLETSKPFDGTPPQPFYNYYDALNLTSDEKASMFKAIKSELQRTRKSSYRKFNNLDFENYLFEKNSHPEIVNMTLSKNTILYGPPGTGKTYTLKNEYFEKFTTKSSTQTAEEYYQNLVTDFSWWEVIAAALYDLKNVKVAQIADHYLLKAKIAISSNNNIRATLWGLLQTHTIEGCEYVKYSNRKAPYVFNKLEDSSWVVLPEVLEVEVPEVIELLNKSKKFKPQTIEKKRYVFTTFHQSFSYEDFIEGIKPIVYEDEQNPEKGKQVIYDIIPGLFKEVVTQAKNDRDNNYAIFIDEINRGNIANIFGELITLIEDDKRIDADNYIPAKLPYSGELFGVPPNLYIIGTMNTADRSVEALDTALRRRFSFIEMNPNSSKLNQPDFKCNGVNLEKLLTSINGRIEKLLDKDYCIGHSYFMTIQDHENPLKELTSIFQNKILPLLQEYFYGDWGKIMLVIGDEFINKKVETVKFLSTDSYDDFEEYDEKPIYNFIDPNNWTLDSFKSIYE